MVTLVFLRKGTRWPGDDMRGRWIGEGEASGAFFLQSLGRCSTCLKVCVYTVYPLGSLLESLPRPFMHMHRVAEKFESPSAHVPS